MSPTSASDAARQLKLMLPGEVAATLTEDSRLILPVGTCERFALPLPIGSATIIVERLADDLSAEFGILRAPTIAYGVNPDDVPGYPGRVSLHKRTLHRVLNDLLACWEANGVTEFVLLTAHGYDPHEEALATVATTSARVRVVDLFAVNISDLVGSQRSTDDRSELYLAILRHLTPELVRACPAVPEASAERGARLYERIRARISERIFLAPTPTE